MDILRRPRIRTFFLLSALSLMVMACHPLLTPVNELAGDETGPQLPAVRSWESEADHGPAGMLRLTIPDAKPGDPDFFVEPRNAPEFFIVVTFVEPPTEDQIRESSFIIGKNEGGIVTFSSVSPQRYDQSTGELSFRATLPATAVSISFRVFDNAGVVISERQFAVMPGDVNGDGVVDSADETGLAADGTSASASEQAIRSDVDLDGTVLVANDQPVVTSKVGSPPPGDPPSFDDPPPPSVYAVTYTGNSPSSGSPPVDGNSYLTSDSVTVLGNTGGLSKTGHTFAGWNTQADGLGTSYVAGDTFSIGSANVTLYAEWVPNPYDVVFDANGGAGAMANQSIVFGTSANLSANAFTRSGYAFGGWNTESDGSGTGYGDAASFTMNVTGDILYAQWVSNPYDVVFNANGGSGTMGNQPIGFGTSANLNANAFTRTGYTFAGWDTVAGGGGDAYADGASFTMNVTGDILYAQWTANSYDVVFDANGGTGAMANQSITFDTGATLVGNTFTRTGYTFDGWNTQAGGGGASYPDGASFIMNVTGEILYAQWSANPYDVVFDANGGTGAMANQSITFDDSATLAGNTFTRAGHIFDGWNTDAGGGGIPYADGASFTMDVTGDVLYAQWTPVYTVTYNGNGPTGGSVPIDNNTYLSGESATVLGNTGYLVQTGSIFGGWTDGTFNYVAGDSITVTADITLSAIWNPAITSGTGTSMDPYLIDTPEALDAMRLDLAASYRLTTDIDLGVAPWSSGWDPIGGSSTQFAGELFGNGYRILNLTTTTGVTGTGLFGYISGATISDLGLENVDMSNGGNNMGAIAGSSQPASSTITNSYATGTIVSSGYNLGGLVGYSSGIIVIQSFAVVDISTTSVNASSATGGLVGRNAGGTISHSYALGSVSGTRTVGGLVGDNTGTVEYSYAAGLVTDTTGTEIGGLIGANTNTVTDGYYDTDTTGQADTGKGIGLSSTLMTNSGNFGGWDFATIWDNAANTTRPYLRWQPSGTGSRP